MAQLSYTRNTNLVHPLINMYQKKNGLLIERVSILKGQLIDVVMKVTTFYLLTTWLSSLATAEFSDSTLKSKALNADTLAATLSGMTTKTNTPDMQTIKKEK